MPELLLAALAIMLVSLVGVVSLWGTVEQTVRREIDFLVSFSAGVFLVITIELAREVLEHTANPTIGLGWIIAGIGGLWALFRIVPFFHHHDDTFVPDEHSHLDPRSLIIGDALHNAADGILLASSFAVSKTLGIATAASILVHELVQEISEFFVLRESGYSVRQALAVNFLVSSTLIIGAVGSYFLVEQFEALELPLLGLAAGSFLVIVFHDLIPHSFKEARSQGHIGKHIAAFALGLLLMGTVRFLVGHEG